MTGTILVTYASRYGSTREAAGAIASRLTALGHTTTVAPVSEARPLDGVAAVALGPHRAADGTGAARQQLDAALAKLPWFHPTDVAVFTGRYDPSRLRLADRLITVLPASPLHGVPALDERDRVQVERWADSLDSRLAVPA